MNLATVLIAIIAVLIIGVTAAGIILIGDGDNRLYDVLTSWYEDFQLKDDVPDKSDDLAIYNTLSNGQMTSKETNYMDNIVTGVIASIVTAVVLACVGYVSRTDFVTGYRTRRRQRKCPHIHPPQVTSSGMLQIEAAFISPPGTLQAYCTLCGLETNYYIAKDYINRRIANTLRIVEQETGVKWNWQSNKYN